MNHRTGPHQVKRLDRRVTIMALPTAPAGDPSRLERFEREARTPATLSRPNRAGIYGVEEQDAAKYLVLEFFEGEAAGGDTGSRSPAR